MISPFAPGGGNDILCRTVAQKLAENLKQQVFVENRPGANGIIGTEAAARSAPDGYTIILIPSGHAVNASLYRKLPYDSIKDFAPITLVGWSPLVLAVHPSIPAKNVKELVALAKARPGQLTYVSAGVGASGHLAGALFETMTGTKMVHIPYKGMALAVSDLIGGQVSLTFGTSLSVVPHVRSGRLRALAITGEQRSPAFPDLPTVAESGLPGYEASLWYGFVGPCRAAPGDRPPAQLGDRQCAQATGCPRAAREPGGRCPVQHPRRVRAAARVRSRALGQCRAAGGGAG